MNNNKIKTVTFLRPIVSFIVLIVFVVAVPVPVKAKTCAFGNTDLNFEIFMKPVPHFSMQWDSSITIWVTFACQFECLKQFFLQKVFWVSNNVSVGWQFKFTINTCTRTISLFRTTFLRKSLYHIWRNTERILTVMLSVVD